ncbi:MAG: hypothetical protein QW255_03875 [Candidatus Bilamarchaeaceae archaeon]
MYLNNKIKGMGYNKHTKEDSTSGFKKKEVIAEKNSKMSRFKNIVLSSVLGFAITLKVLNGCGSTEVICVEGLDCPVIEDVNTKDIRFNISDVKKVDSSVSDSQESVDVDSSSDLRDNSENNSPNDDGGRESDDSGSVNAEVGMDEETSDGGVEKEDTNNGDLDGGVKSDSSVEDIEKDTIEDGLSDGGLDDSGFEEVEQYEDTAQLDVEEINDSPDTVDGNNLDAGYVEGNQDIGLDIEDASNDVNTCVPQQGEKEIQLGGHILFHSEIKKYEMWANVYKLVEFIKYCVDGEEREDILREIGVLYKFTKGHSNLGIYEDCINVKPENNIYNLEIFGISYDLVNIGVIHLSLPMTNKNARCEATTTYKVLTSFHTDELCEDKKSDYVYQVLLAWEQKNTIFYERGGNQVSVSYGGWFYDDKEYYVHKLYVRWSGENGKFAANFHFIGIGHDWVIDCSPFEPDFCINIKGRVFYTSGVEVSPLGPAIQLTDGEVTTLLKFEKEIPRISYINVIPYHTTDEEGNLCTLKLIYK